MTALAELVPDFIGSALVLAPHPDDETIGAGGLIHALCERGARLRVVILSDGAASHPNSVACPPAAMVSRRREESLRAMAELGLAARDVHFCEFKDGDSANWDFDGIACSRFTAAVYRPRSLGMWDVVCLPGERDGHPDHVKTREMGLAQARPRKMRLEYTVWPEAGAARDETVVLRLGGRALAAKRAALRCYGSQLGGVPDDPEGFVIDDDLFARFAAPEERFRLVEV